MKRNPSRNNKAIAMGRTNTRSNACHMNTRVKAKITLVSLSVTAAFQYTRSNASAQHW